MEFNVKFELSDQTFPVKFENIQTVSAGPVDTVTITQVESMLFIE